MTTTVEKRLRRIINIVYFAIIIGAGFLFLKYCFGIVFPFVFAFFIAMIVQRPTNACYKKLQKGKGIISTVFVLTLIFIALAFASLAGAQIVETGKDFVSFVTQKINNFPTFIENVEKWILGIITMLPDSLENKLSLSITSSLERFKELTASEAAGILVQSTTDSDFSITSLIAPIGGGIWGVVKEIPSILIATVIAVIASCFMASDYDRIVGFLKNQLSLKNRNALSKSKAVLFDTIKSLVKAYGSIMLITFAELFVGLSVLKLFGIYNSGHVIIICIITAIVDIIPVLGTGTVLIPWAIYNLITGKYSLAVGLFIIYVVVLVIRQVLEPKLVSTTSGLPPIITIAAMYLGTQLFGVLGIFLLPMILIMIKRLNDEGVLHLWKTGKSTVDEHEK